jgi:hypothetical protein
MCDAARKHYFRSTSIADGDEFSASPEICGFSCPVSCEISSWMRNEDSHVNEIRDPCPVIRVPCCGMQQLPSSFGCMENTIDSTSAWRFLRKLRVVAPSINGCGVVWPLHSTFKKSAFRIANVGASASTKCSSMFGSCFGYAV